MIHLYGQPRDRREGFAEPTSTSPTSLAGEFDLRRGQHE